jgi:hypothetical protein
MVCPYGRLRSPPKSASGRGVADPCDVVRRILPSDNEGIFQEDPRKVLAVHGVIDEEVGGDRDQLSLVVVFKQGTGFYGYRGHVLSSSRLSVHQR